MESGHWSAVNEIVSGLKEAGDFDASELRKALSYLRRHMDEPQKLFDYLAAQDRLAQHVAHPGKTRESWPKLARIVAPQLKKMKTAAGRALVLCHAYWRLVYELRDQE